MIYFDLGWRAEIPVDAQKIFEKCKILIFVDPIA